MRAGKNRVKEFGKRCHKEAEPTGRKPTVLDRLKDAGRRWWAVGGPRKTSTPQGKRFRGALLAP